MKAQQDHKTARSFIDIAFFNAKEVSRYARFRDDFHRTFYFVLGSAH
jgi:hypothetical protein